MTQAETHTCVHRWKLNEASMGKIRGLCRRCGAQRTYPSSLEYFEAVPDYEELDRSRPALFAEPVS